MRPLSRRGPGQGAAVRSRASRLCYRRRRSVTSAARNASEPSANLAPRLDREGQQFPWVRIHFITSYRRGKSRGRHVAHVDVCSKAVNGGTNRLVRRAASVAGPVRQRRGVGGASRRAGVTGPARTGGSSDERRTGVIGSVGMSAKPGQRQLTQRRCARVSAQRRPTKIFVSGCAIDRAATSRSG